MLKKSIVLTFFFNVMFSSIAFSLPVGANLVEFNGLKWLSPVHSAGIHTYKMVNYLSDPASDYYGLRHATRYELDELARAFGFDVQPYQAETKAVHFNDNLPPLYELFGVTRHWEDHSDFIAGVIAEGWFRWNRYYAYFFDYYRDDRLEFQDIYSTATTIHNSNYSPYIGHWLIAEGSLFPTPDNTMAPVPEPSTFLLISFGLVGIWYVGRKRKA